MYLYLSIEELFTHTLLYKYSAIVVCFYMEHTKGLCTLMEVCIITLLSLSLQIKKIYVSENESIGEDEVILEFYEDSSDTDAAAVQTSSA